MPAKNYQDFKRKLVRGQSKAVHIQRRVGGRDAMRCFACGFFAEEINVLHHIKPVAKDGESWAENLVTLCPNCHALVHKMNRWTWCDVYKRRDSILYYGIDFARAFKLAILSTEQVFFELDGTLTPRTLRCPHETLTNPELVELLCTPQ